MPVPCAACEHLHWWVLHSLCSVGPCISAEANPAVLRLAAPATRKRDIGRVSQGSQPRTWRIRHSCRTRTGPTLGGGVEPASLCLTEALGGPEPSAWPDDASRMTRALQPSVFFDSRQWTSVVAFTISTFGATSHRVAAHRGSCEIAYSDSPTAWRASSL